ncbi:MAG: TPM domain-containing protein [Candidatus Zixiibacteriota bacterium]
MKRLLVVVLILLAAAGVFADSQIPDHKGLINDVSGVLSKDEVRQLESRAQAYRTQSGNEISVLIVATIGDRPLEDYAHDVFSSWGVGKKDKDNGVLFLVAVKDRKARVEVGYGLEGELTDIECGRLVNKNSPMAQHFRSRDYFAGVNAVFDGIVQAIGGEYNPPEDSKSDGKSALFPFGVIVAVLLMALFGRGHSNNNRRFGGPFIGGLAAGMLGGLGRRGGFSIGGGSFGGGGGGGFGGGSSGGGGASGGW